MAWLDGYPYLDRTEAQESPFDEFPQRDFQVYFCLACVFALLNKFDQAFKALAKTGKNQFNSEQVKNLQGYFHALKEPDTDKIYVKQEIIEAIRQMEFRCRAGKFIDEKSLEFFPQAFVGYHGTTDIFAAQILNGIKPKKSDQRQYQGNGFYIAADRDIACYFANRKVQEEKQGNAVVLKIFTSHALVGKQVPVKFKWKTTTENCYDFLKGKIKGFESCFQYYVFENSLNKLYTPEPPEAVHWSEQEYQDFQKGYIGSCSY